MPRLCHAEASSCRRTYSRDDVPNLITEELDISKVDSSALTHHHSLAAHSTWSRVSALTPILLAANPRRTHRDLGIS